MLLKRKAGILYPIQSFFKNGKFDIFCGDWGNYRVLNLIKGMGFKVLQILPINPICRISFSPYSGNSALGLEYSFLSVDNLVNEGLVDEKDVEEILLEFERYENEDKIDYVSNFTFKDRVLKKAYQRVKNGILGELEKFINQNQWVRNYAAFYSIKQIENGKPWYEWDEKFKYYENIDWQKLFNLVDPDIFYFYVFTQYISLKQYLSFKEYTNANGILILGDIPIYVSHDSVDVWANRSIFLLDSYGYPEFVAGVPPDYFSEDGQLWGNPVYNWNELERQDFKWWIDRLMFAFKIYDWVRIDHFRGLVAFWSVKYGEKTAKNGFWVEGKPYEFFDTLLDYKPVLPIIAEDLGIITEDVNMFRLHYNIAGMRVLQFAFSDPDNIHLPHNYDKNLVAYTGTHDNNTTKGWFRQENPNVEFIKKYVGIQNLDECNITDELVKLLFSSIANLVVVPIQDVLDLDEKYRMNKPGTSENNWVYRDCLLNQKILELSEKFNHLIHIYKRV